MRLLMVDDQSSVLDGLLSGIDWDALAFAQVDTASNVAQAKEAFQRAQVDILLCDIEMPGENGLQLFAWIGEQGYDTHCIFLTSHADFCYARQALQLGAFEYIVQPAPYSEIQAALEKAQQAVLRKRRQKEMYDMGVAFRQHTPALAATTLRNALQGAQNPLDNTSLAALRIAPVEGKTGYLLLLQIVQWHSLAEKWENALLAMAMNNLLGEIFEPHRQRIMTCFMEGSTFAVLLQPENPENLIPEEILRQQLVYFSGICEQYIHCSFSYYYIFPAGLGGLADAWQQLRRQRDQNVTLKPGIYALHEPEAETGGIFRLPEIRQWGSLLKEGYNHTVEQQAIVLLDTLAAQERLNAETLLFFYQDFMQMLHGVTDGNEALFHSLFSHADALELYRDGMKTIEGMKQLIQYTLGNLQVNQPPQQDSQAIVQQARQYVSDHIEEEIRRDDIAGHVHLHPDYLTRIFKKETGMTLKEYVMRQKMNEAQSLLRTTNMPVSFVAAKLGYSNFSHFSFAYRKMMGMSPQEERSEPKGK